MLSKLKKFYEDIKNLNKSVNNYQTDSIVPSLPTVAYVNKAKKLIESKDYKSATEVLISAIDISDKDPLVYKYLGKIAEINRNFKDSAAYYEKSANLNPNDKEIWLRLGMSYLYSDVLDKAVHCFELADRLAPMNTDVFTGWGMVYMKQKKYALAKDKFNRAAQISKYNFTAILLSAVMEMRLEEYAIAEEKLRFLVKVAPNEGSLYEYAHLKLLQNKFDDAEKYTNKVLLLNKFMLPAYFILGEIYSIRKDYEKVQDNFKTAENNGLQNTNLYFEWGKSLIRLLKFDQAREKFRKALDMDADYNEAKIGIALLNSYENNFELLYNLKEQYMGNVYIQEAMGLEMLSYDDAKNAEEMFKKALATDRYQTYNYYNLARTYIKLNNRYKTGEYFDKFTQSNPQYVQGYIDYAQWLINVSDFEEAQRKAKKALKLAPDNTEALNILFLAQYTLVKKNICEYNIKEAISVADRALELGKFDYTPQKQELEHMLANFQGN